MTHKIRSKERETDKKANKKKQDATTHASIIIIIIIIIHIIIIIISIHCFQRIIPQSTYTLPVHCDDALYKFTFTFRLYIYVTYAPLIHLT